MVVFNVSIYTGIAKYIPGNTVESCSNPFMTNRKETNGK